jgi:hypothetical protein
MTHRLSRLILSLLPVLGLVFGAGGAQAAEFTAESFASVPRYSSAPVGSGREPVSFIYLGTEDQIIRLFVDRGWNGADPISASSLAQAYRAARADAPYPTAPFSPAFVDGQVQDLSFQLPTEANSIRERHHTRIWLTDTVVDGQLVWVGTASLDVSIATIGSAFLPVHHIDPNLPAEREFILGHLGLAGAPYVMLTPAGAGSNSFGDDYTHDGLAAIIDLSGTPGTPAPSPTPPPAAEPEFANVSSFQPTTISERIRECFSQAASYFTGR